MAPNTAASISMTLILSVQNLAAAAGVISIAAINTTPTACMPSTTANTVKDVSRSLKNLTGKPKEVAKFSSNARNVNSLKNKSIVITITTAKLPKVYISSWVSEVAFPNKKLSSPDWFGLPECWIKVSNKIPKPKNTESISASAVCYFVQYIYR
jgi:hypothetical protein